MEKFNAIEEAIADIKLGKIVVVVDDEDRENEGDFVMAADKVSAPAINFMATYGRGLICTPIKEERARELKLDLMISPNSSQYKTAFTVSIDAEDSGTGISALDRCNTIKALINPKSSPEDFRRPGHIFPLITCDGGVLEREGHTEASIELSRLAGCHHSAVICEICDKDGSMARRPRLFELAKEFDLKIIRIKDLVEYRLQTEVLIKQVSSINLPNIYGDFDLYAFENQFSDEYYLAFIKGNLKGEEPVLTRIHSECLTGDIFGSKRCDCGAQLASSMNLIEEMGRGICIYLRQEGRGIGLLNKIKSYNLQDLGHDTVSANHHLGFHADLRTYHFAAQILKYFMISKVHLMTNNPQKMEDLKKCGVMVERRIPLEIISNPHNKKYLETKRNRMGHLLKEKGEKSLPKSGRELS